MNNDKKNLLKDILKEFLDIPLSQSFNFKVPIFNGKYSFATSIIMKGNPICICIGKASLFMQPIELKKFYVNNRMPSGWKLVPLDELLSKIDRK